MLHGSALPDPAPGDSARWGGRTSGLGRGHRVPDGLLHRGLQLPPVLSSRLRMVGHRLLGVVRPFPPDGRRSIPCRVLLVGPAAFTGRPPVLLLQPEHLGVRIIRSLLQGHKVVVQFDCHGRILGGGYDSGPQPLGEQHLVLLRPRTPGYDECPDRVVDLRERTRRNRAGRSGGHAEQDIGLHPQSYCGKR